MGGWETFGWRWGASPARQVRTTRPPCTLKGRRARILYFKDPNLKELEKSVSDKIGLRIFIKNKKNNTGSVLFEYKDLDQLNKLIDVIKFNY